MTQPAIIEVRLARTAAEIDAAQRLRYQVFFQEWGARADNASHVSGRDSDAFDPLMERLIVIDHSRSLAKGQVVNNYRLLRRDRIGAAIGDGAYVDHQFNSVDVCIVMGPAPGHEALHPDAPGGTALMDAAA